MIGGHMHVQKFGQLDWFHNKHIEQELSQVGKPLDKVSWELLSQSTQKFLIHPLSYLIRNNYEPLSRLAPGDVED